MEIIEIRSSHSLVTRITEQRPAGAHAYQVNCHNFNTEYKNWRKKSAATWHVLGVMTLGFEEIWITEAESQQVAEAIQAARSPVAVD